MQGIRITVAGICFTAAVDINGNHPCTHSVDSAEQAADLIREIAVIGKTEDAVNDHISVFQQLINIFFPYKNAGRHFFLCF